MRKVCFNQWNIASSKRRARNSWLSYFACCIVRRWCCDSAVLLNIGSACLHCLSVVLVHSACLYCLSVVLVCIGCLQGYSIVSDCPSCAVSSPLPKHPHRVQLASQVAEVTERSTTVATQLSAIKEAQLGHATQLAEAARRITVVSEDMTARVD